ncbi:L-threonine O-3-phosphate decarboxylase [Luteibacter sp. UNC138MFCol5.1]|uniref:threonine-phosphate decarboxylase CobD n=1 Tax=Luteibacter sp. UNC138MFCol5.1 TaxID=1502774 RepID=UPI0008D87020|nr:threonine-phosphate decarboxylase CobD [Luteibacter sp. UNC138MFCol5.1]SEO41917.1 L-threonine O-3-phosphate decarboxylase [Luteibacter sp. UNC138MFCol5.1]
MLEHGGRLARAARRYGVPVEAWLDLSTGISPFAWPVTSMPAAAWHRLPEEDDGLADAARAYYGTAHLLPVAGSQAAIAALPRLRAPSRVAVIAPGYAEHAHAWRQAGHAVTTLPWADLRERAGEFDVVVLIRPNNPTGEWLGTSDILACHDIVGAHLGATGARATLPREQEIPWLIVDEAFIDTRPDDSVTPHARDGLIVLRSVGKFFGLAGARAGFVAAAPAILDALAEMLGPWTLSGPTRHVVTRALNDRVWQASARECLRHAAARLATLLGRHGLNPDGGSDFFQYVRRHDAAVIADRLTRHAILVRVFDDPSALRFGLPGDDAAFARLDRALAEVTR